jgi:hypothetical protein
MNEKENIMQLSHVLPNLKNRWINAWKIRHLSHRLGDLALQFLGYVIITLLMIGTAAGLTVSMLPPDLHALAIQFLALVYLCLLGIVIARAFDTNHIQYLLAKLDSEMERIESNTSSPEIYELRKAVEELTDRVGHS